MIKNILVFWPGPGFGKKFNPGYSRALVPGSRSIWWQLRFDLLVDICIADFDFNGKYLKLRCANLYFKSLFYLHDYFKP